MLDHGTLHFTLEENILIIDGRGPWNKEALLLSVANANAVQQNRSGDKWAVLVNVTGDPLHTPDAEELLVEYIKYDKQHGRVATALILTNSTSPELGKRHIADLYNRAGEQYQFFNNSAEAKSWLRALLVQERINN